MIAMIVVKNDNKEYVGQYLLFRNKGYIGNRDNIQDKGFIYKLRLIYKCIKSCIMNNCQPIYMMKCQSGVERIRLVFMNNAVNYIYVNGLQWRTYKLDYTDIPDDYGVVALNTDYYDVYGDYRLYANRIIFNVLFDKQIIDKLALIGVICKEDAKEHLYTMFVKKENLDALVNELNKYVAYIYPEVFKNS